MGVLKRAVKLTGILILSLVLLLGIVFATAYFFRDKIISMAINRINNNLDSPVKVDKVSLDALGNFPDLTLRLYNVKISESHKITGLPICQAGNIEISFGLFDLIVGKYTFQGLSIDNAVLDLALDTAGNTNYHIFKDRKENDQGASDVIVNFRKISLKNVSFNFTSFANGNALILHTPALESRLKYSSDKIHAKVSGTIKSEKVYINGINYLAGETSELKSEFVYNLDSDWVNFTNSSLEINHFNYILNGRVGTTGEEKIDLSIQSERSDLKALTSLLPAKYREYLKDYQSQGDINFRGTVKGELISESNPLVNFEFGCREVTLYHPQINKSLKDVSFTGSFTNGSGRNYQTSDLEIKNLKGVLDNRAFSGELSLVNLNTMNINLDLTADLNLGTVLTLFPVKNIKSGAGTMTVNVKISGPLKPAADKGEREGSGILASGDLTLNNADLQTYYSESSLTGLNGIFHFNNEDLAIESFSGKIGSSDFRISGFFKNLLPFIFLPDQPILIDADFQSGFLNLNELLQANFSYGNPQPADSGYHLDISPKLDVSLNCRAREVILKKFSARNVTGHVTIRDQRIIVDTAKMNSMGGNLTLSGTVSARQPNNREILADGHLEGIYIDSVFYVFNNFNQDFLVSHHLKGQIFADVNTFLALDRNLKFKPKSLMSFINISIVNGELNNFEPMQKLSKYIDSEALKHLKFSELRNDITVKDEVITIPQMDIISNVSTIKVSGTHTFDQHIDYHFTVPLSQFGKEDPDMKFGEVESSDGGMNVFLKMTGTTDDYKVTYDTKAMKNKIASDFKQEGQELKEIFKKKETKPDTKVKLDENDYFDQ